MSDNKWLMFKNYMHNELDITKEDIRQWIKEAVSEQAESIILNTFTKWNPDAIVKNILIEHGFFDNRSLNEKIIKKAAEILAEQMEIKLK